MAPGWIKKVGQWLKQQVPKIVKAVPKVLDVAGSVVSTVNPTAGAALKATGSFLNPYTGKLAKTTNKAFNGTSSFKPISDRSIESVGEFANDGMAFLKPWMKRFSAKR